MPRVRVAALAILFTAAPLLAGPPKRDPRFAKDVLFALYVSVRSNKGRFNGGRGIEGIGVPPDEVVEYDPRDLAEGIDTMIRRAEEILSGEPNVRPRFR